MKLENNNIESEDYVMENSTMFDVWVELRKTNIPTKVEEMLKEHLKSTNMCRNIPGLGCFFFTYENNDSYFMKIGTIFPDKMEINVYTDSSLEIDYSIYLEEHLVLPSVDEMFIQITKNNYIPASQPIKLNDNIIFDGKEYKLCLSAYKKEADCDHLVFTPQF